MDKKFETNFRFHVKHFTGSLRKTSEFDIFFKVNMDLSFLLHIKDSVSLKGNWLHFSLPQLCHCYCKNL